jgi:arylsulfatase A-like enzyme
LSRSTALASLLLLAGCGPTEAPRTVVLISLDSVRADALDPRDADTAPAIARLAERGTVFTEAVSGSSWTLPAHAQMFTGAPPAFHGVQRDDFAIDPLVQTLPVALSEAGWFTAGWWTGWYLAGEYGFSRGFSVYENAMTGGPELEREYRAAMTDGDHARARTVFTSRDVRSHSDVTSPNVLARAREVLPHVPGDQDLFLFVHLFDPHYDYAPPAPWDSHFDPDYEGDVDGRDFYRNRAIWNPTRTPRRQISDRDLEHVEALYRGEIRWSDEHLGELFDLLEEHGRMDDALVIVTADHGEEFFEHDGRGHRHSLYDELLRVPLLIVPPSGTTVVPDVDAQVTLDDLLPTILDFAGLEPGPDVRGRSLLGAVRGDRRLAPRPALGSLSMLKGEGRRATEVWLMDSVRTREEKLVRHVIVADGERRVHGLEWFDLTSDPGEQFPVRDPSDPRVRAAWELLEEELDDIRARWRSGERAGQDRRRTAVAELLREDLVALGYAGDEGDEGEAPPTALPWGLAPPPRLEPPELVPPE